MCRKPEQPRLKPEHIDPELVKPRLKPEHSDPEPEHTRPKPEHHSCGLKLHNFPMFFASKSASTSWVDAFFASKSASET